MIYESTRDINKKISPSEAILQGLSEEGGLFVLRDLGKNKLDLRDLVGKNYYEIAEKVLKLFVDFSEQEIKDCVNNAYRGKFSDENITPLVKLSDGYILELFNGPTSAFKDVGLSLLPQLTKTALTKVKAKNDILILTATSGDTGKAALEGFKDVTGTKIMVFYPNDGVSTVQKMQMQTQEGKNTKVCAIYGNFDDAQSGIKELFTDEEFKKQLLEKNIKLSSANSINIGRLIPQIVYYIVAYVDLIKEQKITIGEKINFIVPTGNFGNILAGYYAEQIGLPINKLICASNSNNVLHDFLTTGIYNKNRKFLKTISPSMDILISSNLERLIYYMSGCNNKYVDKLMEDLKKTGCYKVTDDILRKITDKFQSGFADDDATKKIIKDIYEKDGYLLDTHTAVAYKVLLDNPDKEHINVVLSTASPYKFTESVYSAINGTSDKDEFELMKELNRKTQVSIPKNLKDLDKKEIRHKDVIKKENMKKYILEKLGEL
ncbi:threonine synthase [Gemella bergeri ATCC 700627]|uniref:Threonine synthase n=1 Tax=Gemella bergeri ATCC 700627 TaxID=1321820 RepID=U2QVJ4_9BACL|nr:threonine synthase [Gemella bergeri]ERK60556.1 threonine synthase [Gemella bergeri ATCC 700627]